MPFYFIFTFTSPGWGTYIRTSSFSYLWPAGSNFFPPAFSFQCAPMWCEQTDNMLIRFSYCLVQTLRFYFPPIPCLQSLRSRKLLQCWTLFCFAPWLPPQIRVLQNVVHPKCASPPPIGTGPLLDLWPFSLLFLAKSVFKIFILPPCLFPLLFCDKYLICVRRWNKNSLMPFCPSTLPIFLPLPNFFVNALVPSLFMFKIPLRSGGGGRFFIDRISIFKTANSPETRGLRAYAQAV